MGKAKNFGLQSRTRILILSGGLVVSFFPTCIPDLTNLIVVALSEVGETQIIILMYVTKVIH